MQSAINVCQGIGRQWPCVIYIHRRTNNAVEKAEKYEADGTNATTVCQWTDTLIDLRLHGLWEKISLNAVYLFELYFKQEINMINKHCFVSDRQNVNNLANGNGFQAAASRQHLRLIRFSPFWINVNQLHQNLASRNKILSFITDRCGNFAYDSPVSKDFIKEEKSHDFWWRFMNSHEHSSERCEMIRCWQWNLMSSAMTYRYYFYWGIKFFPPKTRHPWKWKTLSIIQSIDLKTAITGRMRWSFIKILVNIIERRLMRPKFILSQKHSLNAKRSLSMSSM